MEEHSTQALSKENKDLFINITVSEAAWLMNKLGLSVGELSPFQMTKGMSGSDAEKVSLAGKALLDNAGHIPDAIASCMKTFAHPGCEMIIDIGNHVLLNFMRIYFGPDRLTAGCTPIDASSFRLAPALKFEDILVAILDGLHLNSDIRENPISCDFSQKGLLAMAALIDAMRQNQLRSLLNRNNNESILVDFIDIWACLHRGLIDDDFRWLTTVVRSRMPEEITVQQATLSEGLAELETAGIASREDNAWTIADNYIEVLTQLMTPLHFGSIFARSLSDNDAIRLFLIKCPTSLWAVNFGVKVGNVSLFTLSVDRLGTLLADIMARLMVIAERNTQIHHDAPQAASTIPNNQLASEVAKENISQQTPPTVKAARFCSQCGLPVKPEQKFCQNCGNALSGRK